jgi:hypothetical protein
MGKGHNYENQNIKIQKEHRKCFKASEHRKCLFSSSLLRQSEHQKCLFSSSLLQQSEHQKNIKIKTFDDLILPMWSKKITPSKIKISTTYGLLPMVTKDCGGLG